MNAKEIMDKKFEKGFNGYKMESVDEFLRDLSIEFSELQTQNDSLEKKLEILADKIREYRNDEDAIKNALLSAQRESVNVIAAAKEKAETIISEAQAKADQINAEANEKSAETIRTADANAHKLIEEAQEKVATQEELIKKLIADGEVEKARVEAEYDKKEKELVSKFESQIKKEEAILTRTRKESQDFCDRMIVLYKSHIEMIREIPEKCDNEFVKELAQKEEPKFTEPLEDEEKEEEPIEEEETKENELEEKASVASESAVTEEEVEFKPMFEEADVAEEELFATKEVEIPDENSPFFTPEKHHTKYEKLEFGKNNQ